MSNNINKLKGWSDCSKDPTPQDVTDSTPALAQSMGLNQECQKTASANASSGEARADASVGFGLASASASASFTHDESNMSESGCGQFFVNAGKTIQSMKNLNCTIKNTSCSAQNTVRQVNSISLITQFTDAQSNTLINLNNNIASLAALPQTPAIKNVMNLYQNEINNISGSITITNSTISQSAKGSVTTLCSLTDTMSNALKQSSDTIAKAAYDTALTGSFGLTSSDPNIKSVTDNYFSNHSDNTLQTVQDSYNKVANTALQGNTLVINPSGSLTISDSVISQDSIINMAAKGITQSSMTNGITTANKLVQDITSQNTSKFTGEQLSSLTKALGEANAAALKAGAPKSILQMIIIGVIAVAVIGAIGGIFVAISKSKGKGKVNSGNVAWGKRLQYGRRW